jgi:hypothetical protein
MSIFHPKPVQENIEEDEQATPIVVSGKPALKDGFRPN